MIPVTFEGHFGNQLSNFLVPLNIFVTDKTTHLKFVRQIVFDKCKPHGGYFSAHAYAQLRAVCQRQLNYYKKVLDDNLTKCRDVVGLHLSLYFY